jgi:hypothetical protein
MEASLIVQKQIKKIDVGNMNNQSKISFRVLQISRPSELGYDSQQKTGSCTSAFEADAEILFSFSFVYIAPPNPLHRQYLVEKLNRFGR